MSMVVTVCLIQIVMWSRMSFNLVIIGELGDLFICNHYLKPAFSTDDYKRWVAIWGAIWGYYCNRNICQCVWRVG